MDRDELFNTPIVKQFEFDQNVAVVFDDMVSRSVPFYPQTQELIVAYLDDIIKPHQKVYDLGCSTATTLLALEQKSQHPLKLIGIDNSQAMLDQAKRKLEAYNSQVEVFEGDISEVVLEDADIVLANYTLQFIRPLKRQQLLHAIYNALSDEGTLIISEKLICEDKSMDKAFIDLYYAYKETQGYSKSEIMQKREALENVLVPYTYEENVEMLKAAGFSKVETLFRWVNFATIIAKK